MVNSPGGSRTTPPTWPVNLVLKEEIGREPLRPRRVDAAGRVAKAEPPHGRCAVSVQHLQLDRHGGPDIEQDRHLAAEAEILRALADIEGQRGLALPRFRGVQDGEDVLHLQSRELGRHGRAGEDLGVEKAVLVGGHVAGPATRDDRSGLRARQP
jgi:hypothetical protein